MRRFIVLMLLLAGPASAQTTPAPSVTAPRTAADTVQGLHQLFQRHRRLGGLLLGGALVADVTAAAISAPSQNPSTGGGSGYGSLGSPLSAFTFNDYLLIYGIMLTPVAGVGAQQLISYNGQREARLTARYEATHQLPARLARRVGRQLRKK